jgi:hypothetical protein
MRSAFLFAGKENHASAIDAFPGKSRAMSMSGTGVPRSRRAAVGNGLRFQRDESRTLAKPLPLIGPARLSAYPAAAFRVTAARTIFTTGKKWRKMERNGEKWSEMAGGDRRLPQIACVASMSQARVASSTCGATTSRTRAW